MRPFKKVTRYQTATGREYTTEADARAHVETVILDNIRNILNRYEIVKTRLTAADTIGLTMHLYENRDQLRDALTFELYGEEE